MTVILATKNLHKIREIRDILSCVKDLDLVTLLNYPSYQPTEELGSSFEERAAAKALQAAKSFNKWALADSTGLVIPALKEESALLCKQHPPSTDKELRKQLLALMNGLESEKRYAYFHCSISLASPDGVIKTATAKTEGMIAKEEKGNSGFGFDSLFIKHEYDKTFAEMDEMTKNRISHRRKALDRIIPLLEGRKPVSKDAPCQS